MIASIENVSSLTGGQSFIAQDILKALDRLNEVTRFEYLLGYYPDNEKWNGEYRKINVRVKRPGLKVSFRHGYYASNTIRPYDLMENLAYSRISAAAAYESELKDIPFQVSTKKGINVGGAQNMEIGLRVDASKVNFEVVDNRHCGTLKVAVFYSDSGGNYLGEEWENADLKLQEASYQSALRDGISISISIPIKAPNQILKIVVYDPGGDKLGSKLLRTK